MKTADGSGSFVEVGSFVRVAHDRRTTTGE